MVPPGRNVCRTVAATVVGVTARSHSRPHAVHSTGVRSKARHARRTSVLSTPYGGRYQWSDFPLMSSTAFRASRSSRVRRVGGTARVQWCVQPWRASSCPSRLIRRISPGLVTAWDPSTKKVAFRWCLARSSRNAGVLVGSCSGGKRWRCRGGCRTGRTGLHQPCGSSSGQGTDPCPLRSAMRNTMGRDPSERGTLMS